MSAVGSASKSFDRVLALVRQRSGIDFNAYRRATIERRVKNRMLAVRAPTLEEYANLLDSRPGELGGLLDALTIKVSRFFRNAPTFELIRQCISSLQVSEARPLRLWSAGCGYGEEAYSLAILLEELEPGGLSLVLATDVDEHALALAREGCYGANAMSETSQARLARRFWTRTSGKATVFAIRRELRRRIYFLRHDLTSLESPPSPKLDLICCRNAVIYFEQTAQHNVQRFLVSCLQPGGYLCLGEAEWLSPTVEENLEVIDRRARLFRRRPLPESRRGQDP